MPMDSANAETQSLRGLTSLQHEVVALLADGNSDERVAVELKVPLEWVRSLQGNLPIAAAVIERQWHRHRAHRLRIRSLCDKALDVVTEELENRPSPELAVAILRVLRVEAPDAIPRSAEVMLRSECRDRAERQMDETEAISGSNWPLRNEGELEQRALKFFKGEALKRLNAPEDPAIGDSEIRST